jgi:hypothetical protein
MGFKEMGYWDEIKAIHNRTELLSDIIANMATTSENLLTHPMCLMSHPNC